MANRPLAELMLHQRFEAVLQRLQIARGTPLAVALSGGADSVALLALASRWAARSEPSAPSLQLQAPLDPAMLDRIQTRSCTM